MVSNLYPFTETVASGADFDGCIEQIDIGGPAMVRSAAKNHANVAVVTSPVAYPDVIKAVEGGGLTLAQRRALAARAFADIAAYDVAIAEWFAVQEAMAAGEWWPAFGGIATTLETTLRYGENPHQQAALYLDASRPAGIAQATQLQGKEMSYNNYIDGDAAWRSANDFAEPCVAIIKHQNPCGIAIGADVAEAHRKAHACDPQSAYGGVIAVNRTVTAEMAAQLKGVFTEVIIAPGYDDDALELLAKKKDLRVLIAPVWTAERVETRQISGGLLAQTADRIDAPGDDPATWTLATGSRRRRGHAGRSGVRVASDPIGEVERDPARPRRWHGRRRDGAGEPRRRGPARGGARRRGAARRRGRGVRRVLPVPGRARDPDGRGHSRGGRAGRLDPRSRGDRGGRGRGHHPLPHRYAALLPLTLTVDHRSWPPHEQAADTEWCPRLRSGCAAG